MERAKATKQARRVESLRPRSGFPEDPALLRPWEPAGHVLAAATSLAAYVLLEWLSFIHELKGVPITPWNPGLGLVFALMILRGARYALVLFAGAIVAEIAVLRTALSWPAILSIAAIIAVGYAVVATVARNVLRVDVALRRLGDVVLLLIAGASGAVLVALLLALLLLFDPLLDPRDILVAVRPLLIGDVIGIAVITPLVLRLVSRERFWHGRAPRVIVTELGLYVAVVLGALWIIVSAAEPQGFRLFYILFLPLVAAAVRYGLDGACVGLAIAQLGLVGLLHGYGYDAAAFTEFQTLMLVLSATGLTVGVVVSERQRAFEAVREVEAELKAKEAEAARAARFSLVGGTAAALAHEINQPMTAARALARSVQEILRSPGADFARADNNLTRLIAQIDHAGDVVRRIREFLRRGRPHASAVDVGDLLEDVVALARPELAARNIRIDVETDADVPPIVGDRVQLQQVVQNLVRNAAEAIAGARASGGRIRLVARRQGDPARVEIGVVDDGPGMADEVAARLFQPLISSKDDGLGLGLSICATIVEAHRGRIWLQSGAPGATEFRFSVPLDGG